MLLGEGPCAVVLEAYTEAKQVARVQLYVSNNQGKTWEMYDEIAPDTPTFCFMAKRPSEYWFTVRLKTKDGTLNPADPADYAPMQRVAVAAGTGSDPLVTVKRKPTPTAAANELDDELTRVELGIIRKELKRLAEAKSFTPEAEQTIDRLSARLQQTRERVSGGQNIRPDALRSSPPVLPPQELPGPANRDETRTTPPPQVVPPLIPTVPKLPVAPMPRAPERPQ